MDEVDLNALRKSLVGNAVRGRPGTISDADIAFLAEETRLDAESVGRIVNEIKGEQK